MDYDSHLTNEFTEAQPHVHNHLLNKHELKSYFVISSEPGAEDRTENTMEMFSILMELTVL